MFEGLRRAGKLSAEQRELLRRKHVEGEYEPTALVELLTGLAEFDRVGDASRSRINLWRGLSVVALFFGFVMGLALHPLFHVATALGLVGVVVFSILAAKLRGLDVNGYLDTALPFLRVLAQDMAPGAKLELRLYLGPATTKAHLVSEGPRRMRFVQGEKVDVYRHPWFSGAAPLATGGRLEWQDSDTTRVLTRTRRSASGKYKTKTKNKRRDLMRVRLTLPRRRYAAADPADPAVREDERHLRIDVVAKAKSSDGWPAPDESGRLDALINLVAAAFSKARIATHERGTA